jgi:hypothetical protein
MEKRAEQNRSAQAGTKAVYSIKRERASRLSTPQSIMKTKICRVNGDVDKKTIGAQ